VVSADRNKGQGTLRRGIKQPYTNIDVTLHSIAHPSFPLQDEERTAAAAAAAKLKGKKHLQLKQHPL
jgi:hypothetical protein